MFIRQFTKWLFPSVMFKGYTKTINGQAVTVLQEDVDEKSLLVRFDSAAITDGGSGYAFGCKHIKSNGDGTASVYINEGSTTSCDFNLVRTPATPGAVQYAEVTVSSAEILALNATPKTLVAAPGAGKVLEFLGAVAILDYNSAAYSGIEATEDLVVRNGNSSGVIVSNTLEVTGFLDQTQDQVRTHKPIVTDHTVPVNEPLVLHMLNGEVTTGNSPLRYKVSYRIHNTGL